MLFSLLLSCNNKETEDKTTITPGINILELEDTNKLVIYCYGYGSLDPILKPAVRYFERAYNNVEIEYKEFPFDASFGYEEFRTMLKSELLAGDGPDLIIADDMYLFDDIYKTMDSGIFFDLTETVNMDPDFKMNLYNPIVMDSGIYKGKRYIMPIDYSVYPILTLQESLDTENIEFSELSTLEGFLGALKKYMANNIDITDKYVSWMYFDKYLMYYYLLYGDINILDYENRKVDLSNPNIKNLADLSQNIVNYINYPEREFSSYFHEAVQSGRFYSDEPIKGLKTGRIFFNDNMMVSQMISNFYYNYGGLTHDRTPVVIIFPDTNGETTAVVNKYAGIRQRSENKKNAYNFMKMLLSYDVQMLPTQNPNTYYYINIPVLTSATKAYAKMEWEKSGSWTNNDGSVIWEKVPNEIHEQFMEILVNVDSCVLPASAPLRLVLEGLGPYFSGEKTYENCISDLKTRLEIYLTE